MTNNGRVHNNKIEWEQKYYAVKAQGWGQSLTRKTYILQKKYLS